MIRAVGRWLGRALLALIAAGALLWAFGPREDVDLSTRFNTVRISPDPDTYLADAESRIPDLLPHATKRILWVGQPGVKTPLALVYLHGFSASAEEIRPVPDRVAQALGANLYFARYTGHGRTDPDALADGSVNAWLRDTAEALAIARQIGEQTVILATSTGGTLAALALTQPDLREGVKGVAFVSPNFGIHNPAAPVLTLPAARHFLPLVFGPRRVITPRIPGQARYWTTDYPSVAVLPVAAAVQAAQRADYSTVPTPALFTFSDADAVVDAAQTRRIIPLWGGPTTVHPVTLPTGDDAYAHVIAGHVMSPQNTAPTITILLNWIESL